MADLTTGVFHTHQQPSRVRLGQELLKGLEWHWIQMRCHYQQTSMINIVNMVIKLELQC